jgi:hypothetical protein
MQGDPKSWAIPFARQDFGSTHFAESGPQGLNPSVESEYRDEEPAFPSRLAANGNDADGRVGSLGVARGQRPARFTME